MWLLSTRTALSLIGAVAGIALAREFTGFSPLVAVIVGALAGSVLAGLVLSPVADRIDRTLHRMGGPRRFRR
jgi:phosphate/sulfate permease